MKSIKHLTKDEGVALVFLLPFVAIFILFIVIPIISGISISFYTGPFTKFKFIGLANYSKIIQDPLVLTTLINTVSFVVVSTVLYVSLAIVFALWAQNPSTLSTMLRISFYIPSVLVITIMTNIWSVLFRPELGMWADLTQSFGLGDWNWFRDPNLARWTIILSTLWWSIGSNMLIIINTLRSIPRDLYEAAELDGATSIQRFFTITFPHLYSILALLAVLQIIASFKIFGQPFLLTGGGPGHNTRSIVQYIYELGFSARNPGYASAISVCLMVLLITIASIQMKLQKNK